MSHKIKTTFSKIWRIIVKFCKKLLAQLKDKTNLFIFLIILLIMSSGVWLLFLLGMAFDSKALMAAAAAYWAFWAGPMTPFFPLCVAIAIGIRKLLDKLGVTKSISEKNKEKS